MAGLVTDRHYPPLSPTAFVCVTCQVTVGNTSLSLVPAIEAIQYEMHNEHTIDHDRYTTYSGPPSVENNHAWDLLVRRMNLVDGQWDLHASS